MAWHALQIVVTQSISGTGALRIGSVFLSRFYPGAKTFWVPTPTYGNHNPIIKDSGLDIKQYRYYNSKTGGLDFEGMKEDLKVSTANPTGKADAKVAELTQTG